MPCRTHRGLLWALLSVLVLLSACGGDASAPADTSSAPPTDHTLLFVDRSASTGTYPAAEALFADSLARVVRTYLDRPGDRLSAFVVHEKTLAKAYRLDLRNDVRPIEAKEFADDQAMERARYKRQTQTYLDTATARLQAFVRETASRPAFRKWTDLWGTLGVASEELPAPSDSVRMRVYYFSDMFESMPEQGRRDFDARPPQSRSQAEAWARVDAEKLSSRMILRPDRLNDAQFRVLLGTLATKAHAQDVKFYWLELLTELGIPPAQIEYN